MNPLSRFLTKNNNNYKSNEKDMAKNALSSPTYIFYSPSGIQHTSLHYRTECEFY